MAKRRPSWIDVKKVLSQFDREGLLSVVQDLYASSKDNQAFLNTRFFGGENSLEPYKKTIDRALYPNIYGRNPTVTIPQATQAIAAYKKAGGELAGLAELSVFFCECLTGFSSEVGYDGSHTNALLNTFAQALGAACQLSPDERKDFIRRLDRVADISEEFGYGIGIAMGDMLASFGAEIEDDSV